jgi:hypothetical protein
MPATTAIGIHGIESPDDDGRTGVRRLRALGRDSLRFALLVTTWSPLLGRSHEYRT